MPSQLRSLATAVTLSAVTIIAAAGCSSPSTQVDGGGLSKETQTALAEWKSDMDSALDPDGAGQDAAGGVGVGGGSLAVPPGTWSLVMACNGAQRLRFEVLADAESEPSAQRVVRCGAAARLPFEQPLKSTISFRVSTVKGGSLPTKDATKSTFWYVLVSKRG